MAAKPTKRQKTLNAEITWKGGVKFESETGSGHTLTTDGPEASGGENAGARPMELVLIGTGGCASYDVVTILKKMKQPVEGCVCKLSAERADEPPKVFTRIGMHFVVTGHGLSEKKVQRAVHLSADKYCSASIMLKRGGVDIQHSFEIVETSGD